MVILISNSPDMIAVLVVSLAKIQDVGTSAYGPSPQFAPATPRLSSETSPYEVPRLAMATGNRVCGGLQNPIIEAPERHRGRQLDEQQQALDSLRGFVIWNEMKEFSTSQQDQQE